jgi:hypothetical protein
VQVLEGGKKPKGYGDFSKFYLIWVQHGQIEEPEVRNMRPCMNKRGSKMMISKHYQNNWKSSKGHLGPLKGWSYHRGKIEGSYQEDHAT